LTVPAPRPETYRVSHFREHAGFAAALFLPLIRPAVDATHAETLIRGGESISKAAKLPGIGLATLKRHRNGSKTSASGFAE
jgi:hypothetical protein